MKYAQAVKSALRIALAVTLFNVTSLSIAQIIGTTNKISETDFCNKYKCQYIKLDRSDMYENWTYYISQSLNFDIFRETTAKDSVAYLIEARIIGKSAKASDIKIIADLVKTGIGINISPQNFNKCFTSKPEVTIYRSDGIEGYNFVRCKKIDSTETQFTLGSYGP